jgi:rfaE bifunctional protein nucleotidyltransferase chain/domain
MTKNKCVIAFSQLNRRTVTHLTKSRPIVLVGGCFDILHIGHIRFLEEAKITGHSLFVLLESDAKVKLLKGEARPYFSQEERAEMLSSLHAVDAVILLGHAPSDADYKKIISAIRPSVIAVTEHDKNIRKKRGHADRIGAKIHVVPLIKMKSTSRVAKLLGIE